MPVTGRSFRAAKRAFDVVVGFVLLALFAPLMVACAIAIRLESPGPALFRQERTGRHGKRFRMYKFRTMVADAEKLKVELASLNVLEPPDFKVPNDPRITRVGSFLRRTSLDELPQLLNVLRGDMSLVGPRPTSFGPQTYDLWHTYRLEVTPGMTGLWQINGRHEMSFDERLRLDVAYIRRQSIALDIKILALTAGSVMRRAGA